VRPILHLAAVTALSLTITQPAEPQDAQRGQLEGVVFDSVNARPLVGARVVARSADAGANGEGASATDSIGRYQIDSLPSGRYQVGFESSLLDSLEITLTPRTVNVSPGAVARVDLALPSAAKLRSAVCSGATLPAQTGVLYGHVVDAATEAPLAGASVVAAWRERDFDRKTLKPSTIDRTVIDTTDATGWYRFCGVPMGTWLSFQLQHVDRNGPVLRTMVVDSLGIVIRHLSLGAATFTTAAPTEGARATARLASGTAALAGVVRGSSGAPLGGAELRVSGTSAVGRTDGAGHYSLGNLPPGTQVLEVRHFGYALTEVAFELRSNVTVPGDVRLQRVVNLDSIRVIAKLERYNEFNDHRKTSLFGVFLDPEALEREHAPYTSDIIEKIPGFRIVGEGIKAEVYGGRGSSLVCGKVNVVIDGLQRQSINDVNPFSIGAVEAYREGEPAPPEYSDRGCGMIVIWTKR
jgi:hypothetical protein